MKKGMTLDQTLDYLVAYSALWKEDFNTKAKEEAKAAIIEIFKGCVPEVKISGKCTNGVLDKDWTSSKDDSWNDCRFRTLENIERLR